MSPCRLVVLRSNTESYARSALSPPPTFIFNPIVWLISFDVSKISGTIRYGRGALVSNTRCTRIHRWYTRIIVTFFHVFFATGSFVNTWKGSYVYPLIFARNKSAKYNKFLCFSVVLSYDHRSGFIFLSPGSRLIPPHGTVAPSRRSRRVLSPPRIPARDRAWTRTKVGSES